MNHNKIYRKINQIESFLFQKSAFPLLGTLPAITKVVMGVAQVVFGSILFLRGTVDFFIKSDKNLIHHGWTHIRHGCGNIVGGLVTSIPVAGTILYFIKNYTSLYNVYNSFATGHENKFMPYEELVKLDLKIGFLGFKSKIHEDLASNGGYPIIHVSQIYNYHERNINHKLHDLKKLQEANCILNNRLTEKGGRVKLCLKEIKLVAQEVLNAYKPLPSRNDKENRNPELETEWDISFDLSKN